MVDAQLAQSKVHKRLMSYPAQQSLGKLMSYRPSMVDAQLVNYKARGKVDVLPAQYG